MRYGCLLRFGATATVGYDVIDLLMTESRDAVGNRVTARNDHPRLVTDPNGNWAEVAFGALGMVVGTARRRPETGPGHLAIMNSSTRSGRSTTRMSPIQP